MFMPVLATSLQCYLDITGSEKSSSKHTGKETTMKDRNNQERSIPRHNEDKSSNQEGFRGSSRTSEESSRRDQNQESIRRDEMERNRSDRGNNRNQ